MNLIGVDPGLCGALAVMNSDGKVLYYCKMPVKKLLEASGKKRNIIDICKVSGIIAKYEPKHLFLEKAQAMPGQGVSSMFNYGVGYGMILGICTALEQVFTTHQIPPQRWHKFMCAPGSEPAKARALCKFHDLWPDLSRENVTHDGIIDAMLIAEYGRRYLSLH